MLPCLLSGCHAICNDLLPPGPISLTPYLFRAILPSMILMPMRQTQSIQERAPSRAQCHETTAVLESGRRGEAPLDGRETGGGCPREGTSHREVPAGLTCMLLSAGTCRSRGTARCRIRGRCRCRPSRRCWQPPSPPCPSRRRRCRLRRSWTPGAPSRPPAADSPSGKALAALCL